jgi:hypothetical protein
MTSRQYFQSFGAKPYVRDILVIEQSRAAIRGSDAPAFIVEKERADG